MRSARTPPRRPGRARGSKVVQRYHTMDDVAAMAGVHPTTVSLALRSHPSIPAATRERILAAALRIGYVRDPLLDAFNSHRLKKLAMKQAHSVAFVIDAGMGPIFSGGACHPLVTEGVRSAAEAQHLTLEMFSLGTPEMTASRLNTILLSRGISGVLLSTFTPTTRSVDLDWNCLSGVKIESHHLLPPLDVVSNDQCQAARLCMRRLRALGYRRIGLATALDDESRLESTFSSGVLVEQAELDERERVPPLLFERRPVPAVIAQVVHWIREHAVDAVMTNWWELIEPAGDGAGRRLTSTSVRIPHDVAFASLDIRPDCPDLAGIVQNHRLVGVRALEQLAVMVRTFSRGAPANPSATYIPGYWRDGATAPGKG
jgi:LacI family transcriptional regulator